MSAWLLCAAGHCAAASRRAHALRLALTSQMKYGLPDAPAAKKRKLDKAASSNPAGKAVRAVLFACLGPLLCAPPATTFVVCQSSKAPDCEGAWSRRQKMGSGIRPRRT